MCVCDLLDPQISIHAIWGFGGNLKYLVSRDNPKTLSDLKGSVSWHMLRISKFASLKWGTCQITSSDDSC